MRIFNHGGKLLSLAMFGASLGAGLLNGGVAFAATPATLTLSQSPSPVPVVSNQILFNTQASGIPATSSGDQFVILDPTCPTAPQVAAGVLDSGQGLAAANADFTCTTTGTHSLIGLDLGVSGSSAVINGVGATTFTV